MEKEPSYTLGGMQIGGATVESIMEVPQKTKIRFTIWSIPLLGGISEENENTNSKRYMHFSVHSNIICNRQDVEAT